MTVSLYRTAEPNLSDNLAIYEKESSERDKSREELDIVKIIHTIPACSITMLNQNEICLRLIKRTAL